MALVLGRACGERVHISTGAGELITIEVAGIGRSEVSLAITAPRTVGIVREERARKDEHGQPIPRGIDRNNLGNKGG